MYTIHHTEGIVLGGRGVGESSRYIYVFTRDFGLIGVYARGLRELSSKLRYGLQNYSLARIDLLQSKNGWKVKSAIPSVDYAPLLNEDDGKFHFAVIARVTALLRRLLQGEAGHENLYRDIVRGFEALRIPPFSREKAESLEIIIVMRVLNHLGYWGEHETLSPVLTQDLSDPSLLGTAQKEKRLAIREINKALQETQL